MQSFEGKVAVVTGGASGMGRELVIQLASVGCHVAMCDLSVEEMDGKPPTRSRCGTVGHRRDHPRV